MLFNSVNFLIFFSIVFFVYWFVLQKRLKWQNLFLLLASYYFYACWNWKFLSLLVFSSSLDYVSGLMIHKADSKTLKKIWLFLSISINIGILGIFKYYNFFIESFSDLLSFIGLTPHFHTLNLILPIGISFYTFHGLSYVIDIYYEKTHPRTNWINYSLFVGYFPLLVAGPIERATHLLPQLEVKRHFDFNKAVDGVRQILWGLFKKVVIADGCAKYVDQVFNNYTELSGISLILGIVFFSFQIYGDFSGYTDIALGVSRLLGIELLQNFNFPYFSKSISEFWRRWHMSLTSWFKDYLYIPLGGSRRGKFITIRNIYIIFIASGLWHGANWTFLAWGLLHAMFLTPNVLLGKKKNMEIAAKGKTWPSIKELSGIVTTFMLATFARIFFRSDSLPDAFAYIRRLPSLSIEEDIFEGRVISYALLIAFMLIVEWQGREKKHALQDLEKKYSKVVCWTFYYSIILLIFIFYGSGRNFIYFQF